MTLFEYLAIAFSLVYSLAALRILGGLPAALAPGRRSFLHSTLTVTLLLLIVLSFWTFWSLREVEWTFQGFLAALLIPGVLYYCAAVLVPENPEVVESWHNHYFDVHRRWYLGIGLWGMATAASATLNLGMGLAHPARGVHLTCVLVGIIGWVSSNETIHKGLVMFLAFIFMAACFAQLEPDWLARQ